MLKLLKQFWWKIIGIILLFYIFIGGLFVPLGPGIKHVSFTDESLFISGKNTHFTNNSEIWLKCNNTELVCIKNFEIISDDLIQISSSNKLLDYETRNFDCSYFDLIINNNYDGTMALWRAFEKSQITGFFKNVLPNSNSCSYEPAITSAQFLSFPNREILNESVRNLLFHVPMWFGMVLLLLFGVISATRYLSSENLRHDLYAKNANLIGLVFGFLGLLTGMVWANFTWGKPWPNDPKLNGAAIGTLVYAAYFILRGSLDDDKKKARLAAVYNIFAFVVYIMFIFVIPRLNVDSLHPGQGGNPAFSNYDLDSTLRLFFYPAVIGWTILGFWIMSILTRLNILETKSEE